MEINGVLTPFTKTNWYSTVPSHGCLKGELILEFSGSRWSKKNKKSS